MADLLDLPQVRAVVKANMLPGQVLWCGLAVLLMAYAWSPAVQAGLMLWGMVNQAGLGLSVCLCVVCAVPRRAGDLLHAHRVAVSRGVTHPELLGADFQVHAQGVDATKAVAAHVFSTGFVALLGTQYKFKIESSWRFLS